jgi:hypothetical protein
MNLAGYPQTDREKREIAHREFLASIGLSAAQTELEVARMHRLADSQERERQ